LGPAQIGRALARHGSPARALDALAELGPAAPRLATADAVAAEAELVAGHGGRLLYRGEPGYPAQLDSLDHAPWMLTVLGDPACLAGPLVAMVGARNASAAGRKMARDMAQGLAEAGIGVVSGLARGIDTAAHEGALDGGVTVAVIATGIDVVYPPENERLMARIGAAGCVVSERALGGSPTAAQFPRRNRLVAGLALGVVVVEAATRSGSLITARLAGDQGREVMAVPGSPMDQRHRGTNQLLREGAHLVETAADVVAALAPFAVAAPSPPPAVRSPRPSEPAPLAPAKPPPLPPGGLEALLKSRLTVEPVAVDELIRQCHASPSQVQKALLELELAGEIERHPGNRVSLAVV
ncbi:MAG: DNA-processing protein DprA, partial [Pseudomonadota bacterium]